MFLDPPLSQTVTPSRTPSPRAWRTIWTASDTLFRFTVYIVLIAL